MPAMNPQIDETWRFKPDGNPNNSKYHGKDVLVKDVTAGTINTMNVRYKFVDKSLRDPAKPNGSVKTLQKFLDKFEFVANTSGLLASNGVVSASPSTGQTVIVKPAAVPDEEVSALLTTTDTTIEVPSTPGTDHIVPVTRYPACAGCTDDTKPLRNGICDGCQSIRSLLAKHGRKFSKQDYYGID